MKAEMKLSDDEDVLELVINDLYIVHITERPGLLTLSTKCWTGMPSKCWIGVPSVSWPILIMVPSDPGEKRMREHESAKS